MQKQKKKKILDKQTISPSFSNRALILIAKYKETKQKKLRNLRKKTNPLL